MKSKKEAAEIVALMEQEYPLSQCFLDNDGAWQLLVAVRLSAQCTDLRVNATTPILFEKFPTVDRLAEAGPGFGISAFLLPYSWILLFVK